MRSKEENFDEMSIEEVDALIMKVQNEIAQCIDIKRRINKHKMMTKKSKNKKLAPIEAELQIMRQRLCIFGADKRRKDSLLREAAQGFTFLQTLHALTTLPEDRINSQPEDGDR